MVMADTSREFQEENEITKFGDNIGVGQFFSVQAKIEVLECSPKLVKICMNCKYFLLFFSQTQTKIQSGRQVTVEVMNNSPIPVKLSMIHKKIQEKNHQNW